MSNKANSFNLFEQDFKEGDEVIIVNHLDLLDWGTLAYDDKGFSLSSGFRPTRHYSWHQCVMMAKDGFPVRKIFGSFPKGDDIKDKQILLRSMLASETVEKLKREIRSIHEILKQCVGSTPPHLIELLNRMEKQIAPLERESNGIYWTSSSSSDDNDSSDASFTTDMWGIKHLVKDPASVRFGCPFEVNDVNLQLYNAGGVGSQFDLTPGEETLRMKHKNGSVAQLWQLTEIFDWSYIIRK